MKLKKIGIKNVKGISDKSFDLNILPNKPSILVAPNGFGKSSIARAFLSMNNNRINLHKDYYYEGDEQNKPEVLIELDNEDGTTTEYSATHNSNTISRNVSVFVINNKLEAKGIRRNIGGTPIFTASMEVQPFVILDSIPENVDFAALNQMNQQNIIVKKNNDGSLKSIVFFAGGTNGFEYAKKGSNKEQLYSGFKVIHYINHFSKTNNYLLTWCG